MPTLDAVHFRDKTVSIEDAFRPLLDFCRELYSVKSNPYLKAYNNVLADHFNQLDIDNLKLYAEVVAGRVRSAFNWQGNHPMLHAANRMLDSTQTLELDVDADSLADNS